MEVDEIQTQSRQQPQKQQQQQHPPPQQQQPPCKYSRVSSNGRIDSNGGTHDGPHTEVIGPTTATTTTETAMMVGNNINNIGSNNASSRFGRQWQHSSRIIRVSRASGGKDRHSKVWTAKGPRDRRVRLSVTTAIQFYDLQDRLGYDQPSKAVEWLIKAASEAINELPCLNTASFPPETPPSRQVSGEDDKKTSMLDSLADNADGPQQHQHQQQQQLGSKSGCSSNNSETSKGSGGLSLSRSEIRVKARERARERTAKDKEPPSSLVNVGSHQQQQNVSSMAQTSSFTQLLTAGMSSLSESSKHPRNHGHNNNNTTTNNNQWLSSGGSSDNTTQMADYFGTGLIGLGNSNTSSLPQAMTIASFGSENQHHHHHHQNPITQHHHQQHHHPHFPFLSDHQNLLQVANAASNGNGGGSGSGGGDYNLNFSISSASSTTSGFNNRGTLQSNSPSLLPYLQRFSDGSSLPFFLGNASAASPNIENHHQHQQQFQPSGLQLCYGDASRQSSDHKGKGKN